MGNLLEERLGKDRSGNSPRGDDDIQFMYPDSDGAHPKKKRRKEPKRMRLSEMELPEFNEEEYIEEETMKASKKAERFERNKRVSLLTEKVIKVILVVAILYVAFLIYGTIVTDYVYDENGNVVPQVYTVEEIREEKEFEILRAHYINIRDLYEKIIILDYRLGLGNEDFIQLASEYESLLVNVNQITVQLEAYTPPIKYSQANKLLLQLVKTDIAVYLQNVSAALAQDNSEKAAKAIIDKETIYNRFTQTTENIISLGENVKGADVYDIKDWSIHKVQESFGIPEGGILA